MAYTKQWGGPHPGCLIILIDQSGSMEEKFGGNQLGAGKRKCDMVATVLNNLLHEFVKTNTIGQEIKPRADIAVLGYEGQSVHSALAGSLSARSFVTLPELMANPLRIDTRIKKEMDDTGNIIEIPIYFPIWVEALAGGGTPMCAALRQARELAEQWATTHRDNYPPVVINITDGMSTDGDPTVPISELGQVRTNDGEVLILNCHITDKSDATIEFPADESSLPNDSFARLLFSLSSVIPESAREEMAKNTGMNLAQGARGFIFNGDAASVRQMFVCATIGATMPIDLNR